MVVFALTVFAFVLFSASALGFFTRTLPPSSVCGILELRWYRNAAGRWNAEKSVLIFTNMMQQHHGSRLIDKTASSILTLKLSCMTTTFIIPICLHTITHRPKSLNVGNWKVLDSFFCISEFLQSLCHVYLIHLWNVSALRGREADRWRNEPQLYIFWSPVR